MPTPPNRPFFLLLFSSSFVLLRPGMDTFYNIKKAGDYPLTYQTSFVLHIRDAESCKVDHGPRKYDEWRFLIILAEAQWRSLDVGVELPFTVKKIDMLECGCAMTYDTADEWRRDFRYNPHARFYLWDFRERDKRPEGPYTPSYQAVGNLNILPIPSSVSWADKVEFRWSADHWEYRYIWMRAGIPNTRKFRTCLAELRTVLTPLERVYTSLSVSKLVSTLQSHTLLMPELMELIATYV